MKTPRLLAFLILPIVVHGQESVQPNAVPVPTIPNAALADTSTNTPVSPVHETGTVVTTTIELGQRLPTLIPVPERIITLTPGSKVILSVNSQSFPDSTATTWLKDGNRIPITTATLEIAAITPADSGRYSAIVTINGRQNATDVAALRVAAGKHMPLLALSTRGRVTAGQPPLIIGLSIGSGTNGKRVEYKSMLIRAVGPTLTQLGASDPLADPTLKIFKADGSEFTEGYGYLTVIGALTPEEHVRQATVSVGTFPLPAGSKDVSQIRPMPPGNYTVQVGSASGSSGNVLVEIYEVSEDFVPHVPPFGVIAQPN